MTEAARAGLTVANGFVCSFVSLHTHSFILYLSLSLILYLSLCLPFSFTLSLFTFKSNEENHWKAHARNSLSHGAGGISVYRGGDFPSSLKGQKKVSFIESVGAWL